MKKPVCVILSIILLLCFPISAYAASFDLSSDKVKIKKGDTVTVSVSLSDTLYDITNFEVNLYFDETCFSLESSTKGKAFSKTKISKLKHKDGAAYYSISYVDTESEGTEIPKGVIYTFSFKAIKDEYKAYSSYFSIKLVSVLDNTFSDVTSVVAGSKEVGIEIEGNGNIIVGDVNGDGEIDIRDVHMLRNASAKLITLSDEQIYAGDVNGDGKVNIVDVNVVRRYVAKYINSFTT